MTPPLANGTGRPWRIAPPFWKATPDSSRVSTLPKVCSSGRKAACSVMRERLRPKRAQDVAEAAAAQRDAFEGIGQRMAELAAEARGLRELLLERCRVGVDLDGPGGEGLVHGSPVVIVDQCRSRQCEARRTRQTRVILGLVPRIQLCAGVERAARRSRLRPAHQSLPDSRRDGSSGTSPRMTL